MAKIIPYWRGLRRSYKVGSILILVFIGALAGGLYYRFNDGSSGDDLQQNDDRGDNDDYGDNDDEGDNGDMHGDYSDDGGEIFTRGYTPANITVLVNVPDNTPQNDVIYIRTGFASGLGEEDLAMERIAPDLWRISMIVPEGMLFRYRFSRNASWDMEESFIPRDGRGAHFRTAYIDGNLTLNDTVSKWEDLSLPAVVKKADISGRIVDSDSGLPIMNLVVSAGNYRTISGFNGTFKFAGIPSGNISVCVFPDFGVNNEYGPVMRYLYVAPGGSGDITINLTRSETCNITFNVTIPINTPTYAVPRIYGDIYGLGLINYFEGTAFDISRIPQMYKSTATKIVNDTALAVWYFNITVSKGIYLRYTYTLGDPFVNVEYYRNMPAPIRGVYVTDDMILTDNVSAWKSDSTIAITFNTSAPNGDPVYITTSLWDGWEPLPMWHTSGNNWTYTMYMQKGSALSYRYLRFGDPKVGREKADPDTNDAFRHLDAPNGDLNVYDIIPEWRYMMKEMPGAAITQPLPAAAARSDGSAFQGGIELVDYYQTSWNTLIPETLQRIAGTNASWVQIASVWGILSDDPVIIDYGWNSIPYPELVRHIEIARSLGLNVAMRAFPYPVDDNFGGFDENHPLSWYDEFFGELNKCLLYHAYIAEEEGVDLLILPNFNWADNNNATAVAYIDGKWNESVGLIRQVYGGNLTTDYYVDRPNYNWYANLDYLGDKWWVPLADNTTSGFDAFKNAALNKLADYYRPIIDRFNKSIVFSEIAYYSANSSEMQKYGVGDTEISEFHPEDDGVPSAWSNQSLAYEAVLHAFAETSWVQGSYSFAYFYYDMDCKGYSIRGKTAEKTLSSLYGIF